MQYTEFISAIEIELRKKTKEGVSITVNHILKNNSVSKAGLTIQREGESTAPTIYLDEFFAAYQKGCSVEKIANEIWCFYEKMNWEPALQLTNVLDAEFAKPRLVPKLINKSMNSRRLMDMPYVEWMDLAIVFYLLLDVNDIGSTFMLVQNTHLKEWKLDKDKLYQISMENAMRLLPAELLPVSAVAFELICGKKLPKCNLFDSDKMKAPDYMYVLTNKIRNFGAVCIVYPYVAQMIAGLLGESYYILPSSIHEVMILPKSQSIEPGGFTDMILEINATQVDEEEVLSGHAYYFDKEKGTFCVQL